jgi:2-isopropylmalate synthase
VTLEIDGEERMAKVEGKGSVEVIFSAISQIIPHEDAHLQLYDVSAVTGGTDAQAEVTVRLEEEGKTVTGQGSDADTLVASARAYVHALNKLMTKRQKSKPE